MRRAGPLLWPARAALRPAALVLAGLAALATPASARAVVPSAAQVAKATAEANRSAGRSRPLSVRVSVTLPGSTEPVASGRLDSDPAGQARLEVHHRSGFVERQLRARGALRASRDGQILTDPRPLLPPLWLLQASNGSELLLRVGELGIDANTVAFGFEGDADCYVLGNRNDGPSLWIDIESLSLVRLDLPGGVRYRFGAELGRGDGVVLPAWVEMEAPGGGPMRLLLDQVVAGAPGQDGYSPAWLEGPASPTPPPPGSAPGGVR